MTLHLSERQGADLLGDRPTAKRGARQAFTSKADGWGRSRNIWMCLRCKARIEKEHPRSPVPVRCTVESCQHHQLLRFDSDKEERRFRELLAWQRAGEIDQLQHHPKFPLWTITVHDGVRVPVLSPKGRQRVYSADSMYRHVATGKWVVEDVKPRAAAGLDPQFELRRDIVEACYGLRITLLK